MTDTRKKRIYEGNPPDHYLHKALLARRQDPTIGTVETWLFIRSRDPATGWLSLKVCDLPASLGKANFWFGYHVGEGRCTYTKDGMTIKESFAQAIHDICESFEQDYLAYVAGKKSLDDLL